MERLGIYEAKDVLVDAAIQSDGFLEFEKTAQGVKSGFLNDRDLYYLLYDMAKDIAKSINERTQKRAMRIEDAAEKERKFNAAVEIGVNTRIKEIEKSGRLMTPKARKKYQSIIKELTRGSHYDFESAMKLEFPNFKVTHKADMT